MVVSDDKQEEIENVIRVMAQPEKREHETLHKAVKWYFNLLLQELSLMSKYKKPKELRIGYEIGG